MSLDAAAAVFSLPMIGTVPPGMCLAYLDPNSGSMLLQLVLGGLAGLGVVVKLYWHRIALFLRISRPQAKTVPNRTDRPASDAEPDPLAAERASGPADPLAAERASGPADTTTAQDHPTSTSGPQ